MTSRDGLAVELGGAQAGAGGEMPAFAALAEIAVAVEAAAALLPDLQARRGLVGRNVLRRDRRAGNEGGREGDGESARELQHEPPDPALIDASNSRHSPSRNLVSYGRIDGTLAQRQHDPFGSAARILVEGITLGLFVDAGRLTERCYAVAEGWGNWDDFVADAGRVFASVHCVLTTGAPDRGTGLATGTAHLWARYDCGSYAGRDLLMERAWRLPRGKLSLVQRVDEDPGFVASPFYRDFLAGSRLRHFIHVLLPEAHGSVAFFCLTRDAGQPEFSSDEVAAVEMLLPHLTRALGQIERRRVDAPRTLFQNCGFGLVVFDAGGRVAAINRTARRLIAGAEGIALGGNALHVAGIGGDFGSYAVARLKADGTPLPTALEIDGVGTAPPIPAVLAAVPGEWRHIGGAPASVMLVLGDPTQAQCPDASTLAQHYGLTGREALFAQVLVEARSLRSTGTQLGIAQETARRHLKSIFEKTRTHSQTELIHLLARHPATFLSRLAN